MRELKLRGLLGRMLIVCPANLDLPMAARAEGEIRRDTSRCCMAPTFASSTASTNGWNASQIITSLDLAKRDDMLPGLRQVHWDMVIVDEAHRMSWTPPSRKTARYALGELLRDTSDHMLLLTATPHKGDPENFTLFLQLLDQDAYADVTSIREAMERRQAPFYLRRTKEAMVYFPERDTDGTWASSESLHPTYSAHCRVRHRR